MAIVSDTNTSPTTSSDAIFSLKTTLVTAGWTVSQSGDGTTYNSTGDQITTAADLANASAWFYIEAPNGQAFTFQNQNNSTAWRIKWRGNGGAVGGSPSATQTPTITDEIIIRGSGTDASPGYTSFLPTNGTYRWNVIADDASPYGFWCVPIAFGGASAYGGMIFDPLTAVSSGDVSPYVVMTATGGDYWQRANPNAGIYWNDENSYSGTSGNYAVYYTASTGTGNRANANAYYLYLGGNSYLNYTQAVNPITGNDDLFPMVWGRRAAAGGGNPGWKGVSTFSKYKGIYRAMGDTYTVSTARDRISINDYSLPWDGSVPVL